MKSPVEGPGETLRRARTGMQVSRFQSQETGALLQSVAASESIMRLFVVDVLNFEYVWREGFLLFRVRRVWWG